ncbi:transmembrane protein 234 homolog isoform X1 [Toxorhynchites rutilus septentrionalis]|uniref:transmembrane protein 234 homolog isoform X1 n=1 Tax=Toxorhynchites rutilus septentrionalis TaxID=329112 RepID=UPI00247A5001|nr:transmembrane protein 234 homolog isoform X1 [Toxorhynchites rutilus septentrionalis]
MSPEQPDIVSGSDFNEINHSVDAFSLLLIILVAVFWGATNPFIRRGTLGYNNIKSNTKLGQLWLELKFLVSRWQYLLALAINQCGSVIYVFALRRTELSLIVPMCNSLTFVFTAVATKLLGEQSAGWNYFILETYLGMMLVISGTTLCSIEKIM